MMIILIALVTLHLCLLASFARSLYEIEWRMTEVRKNMREIVYLLSKIEAALKPVEAAEIELFTIIDGQQQKVDNMNLKVTQMIPMVVKAKDKKGKTAQLDGAPAFSVSDETLATIEEVDGVKFLKPTGELGALVVSVDADGDLGEGVKALHFEAAINLIAGDADVLDIEFGAPIDQP